ncbi:urease accessory protein UreE [Candidatus Macondimonas diazotrophica]|jgi:urease accessory protein|uniref:Urease accessory protein UreE n=1 Tax=Candidatus Macondimonas diazotrophica TaxID=2305248 RepID=A0A4Z0FFE7_9GAMM|nr:urease accessory protein UreE [Candidatus Macondimonas diazotrophica]NCU00550.1 urease accessory protein UreE [Candidatus Macondimonas diazotrophica]TFZ84131.1 urease accessory protein UreE [Candidatus Macondimonas diazotrophica]HBG29250.1 urease accessory protein UreE [Gammaproteobacteria bacterium]HBG51553.1 urease accessory protein UreE [Gammaproteobacteria bacterium]
MLEIRERLAPDESTGECPAGGTLTLAFDARQRSRQRVRLDDGREYALLLPRGTVLQHGDRLRDAHGRIVTVCAAKEAVSTVHTADPLQLARACYHLGNRHVPLQITAHWLRYRHDHVLDDLAIRLGLTVTHEQARFEPESGAYDEGGGHAHHHHPAMHPSP